MPDTACTGTIVPIINTSSGATSFQWNFCEPAWEQMPVLEKLHMPSLEWIHAAAFGVQNGEHFAFVSHGIGRRSISRLDFGSSFGNSSPAITPLGDFGGLVNTNGGKDNLHLVADNGQWYLFVVGVQTRGMNLAYPFVRMSFGPDIKNTTPAAEDLTSVGGFAGPEDVAFVKEGSRWWAFVVNSSASGQLTRLDFGSSLAQLPISTPLGNLGGVLLNPSRIQFFKDNSTWRALVYDVPLDRVVPLRFGDSLKNIPTPLMLTVPSGGANAVYAPGCSNELIGISYSSVAVPQWRSTVYSSVMGTIRTQVWPLAPVVPNVRHWKPIADALGGYVFFSRNALLLSPAQSGDTLFRLRFGGCSGAGLPASSGPVPPPVSFSSPGVYNVRLTIDAGLPSEQSVCRSIVVVAGGNTVSKQQVVLCADSSLRLRPSLPGQPWQWSTGLTDTSITISRPGVYWARLPNQCGELRDSFTVQTIARPAVRLTVQNDVSCAADSAELRAAGARSYQWWPAASLSTDTGKLVKAAPTSSTWYYLKGTDAVGCSAIDSARVLVNLTADANLYLVPNAFTPNADGINDCFSLAHWGNPLRLQFQIYDRWGRVVFASQDVRRCWNGRYAGGEEAPTGAYTYSISAETRCGSIRRKGVVMLIR